MREYRIPCLNWPKRSIEWIVTWSIEPFSVIESFFLYFTNSFVSEQRNIFYKLFNVKNADGISSFKIPMLKSQHVMQFRNFLSKKKSVAVKNHFFDVQSSFFYHFPLTFYFRLFVTDDDVIKRCFKYFCHSFLLLTEQFLS